jgi:hypothetical protein
MTKTKNRRTRIENRVGLYVSEHTRNRLNLFKAQLSFRKKRTCNLDDAITHLLDEVAEPLTEEVELISEPELA